MSGFQDSDPGPMKPDPGTQGSSVFVQSFLHYFVYLLGWHPKPNEEKFQSENS